MPTPTLWHIPYQRNPFFTGREDVLSQLHRTLHAENTVALSHPQGISGLGGIGKTQTALEYAYRYRAEYDAVFWVRADSATSLTSSLVELAHILQLPERNEKDQQVIVHAILHWFRLHTNWLLIYDNIDDLSIAEPFLPQAGSGHLLFTTRAHALGGLAELLDIQKMEPNIGALLLLRRAEMIALKARLDVANPDDQKSARTISEELDGLPLALDQAGAYIKEAPCPLADYLARYRTRRKDHLRERGSFDQNYPASVATTWSLSFGKVSQANPAASELLNLFALLAADAIPEEIITEGSVHLGPRVQSVVADPLELDTTIGTLLAYSLVRRDADLETAGRIISIHRLVQAVLKDTMKSQERLIWVQRAVQAVGQTFPYTTFEMWRRCDLWLPHAQVCIDYINDDHIQTLEAARLLQQTGIYRQKRGRYTEAELPLQKALEMKESLFEEDDLNVAESLHCLAELYRTVRKNAQAESLYQRALEIRKRQLGEEHEAVATSFNDLALCYRSQGKFVDAEPLHVRALEIREKILGPHHLLVATTLNNLAGLYRTRGEYARAEPLFQRALKIRKQQLGDEHPYVGQVLNNLAALNRELEQHAEAEALYLQALRIRESALGPEHSDVAQSLSGLGDLYRAQGRYREAEQVLQHALHIREQNLGKKHWDTTQTLVSLAELNRVQGKDEEAKEFYEQVLQDWDEKETGIMYAAASLNGLAYLHEKRGEYEEAERLLLHALQLYEHEQLEPSAPRIKAIQNHYTSLLQLKRSEEEAAYKAMHERKTFLPLATNIQKKES